MSKDTITLKLSIQFEDSGIWLRVTAVNDETGEMFAIEYLSYYEWCRRGPYMRFLLEYDKMLRRCIERWGKNHFTGIKKIEDRLIPTDEVYVL